MNTAHVVGTLNRRWTPHAGQREALRCALQQDQPTPTFVECGRKFGKTEVIEYFDYRVAALTQLGVYYLAPEQKQAKEIIWATGRVQNFCPELVASINNSDLRLLLMGGGWIKIDGSDNVNRLRGVEPGGLAYDEFKDFRPEFHQAMAPNLAVYNAPLLICGTPPEAPEGDESVEFYDTLKKQCQEAGRYFNFPTWANPHIDRAWLKRERALLYARGEADVWEREYGARRVIGGKKSIFPMFNPARHRKRFDDIIGTLRRDAKKLVWQVGADPGTTTCFAVLFRAVNPFTKVVYRLACIYERDQMETSTSRIVPRIEAMKEEILPNWRARGIEWEQIYDEAAAWFATEAMASFPDLEPWTPTNKGMGGDAEAKKKKGLSLIKDQMLTDRYVITERCGELEQEVIGYIKDKNGKIPKANDHLIDCIAGFEPVETLRGPVFMADIRPGDLVRTRRGFFPVEAQWLVGERNVVRLHFSDGRSLTCTPEHLVYTRNRGFIAAQDLRASDEFDTRAEWPRALQSSSTESPSAATRNQSGEATASTTSRTDLTQSSAFVRSTSRFGRRLTAPFRKVITSIIVTAIRKTTRSKTSNAFLRPSMSASIISACRAMPSAQTSLGFARSQVHGTGVQKGEPGITSTRSAARKPRLLENSFARIAAMLSKASAKLDSAATPASPGIGAQPKLTTSQEPAPSARLPSKPADTAPSDSALRLVRIDRASKPRSVYDLKVRGPSEFYAAGILVHNCDRYLNDSEALDLHFEFEPEAPDPDTQRRGYKPEEDLAGEDDDYDFDADDEDY